MIVLPIFGEGQLELLKFYTTPMHISNCLGAVECVFQVTCELRGVAGRLECIALFARWVAKALLTSSSCDGLRMINDVVLQTD
jgi:hypothetical protein